MNPLSSPDNLEWTTMTPKTIWNQLRSEMKQYYDWEMPCETLEQATEQFTLQKISLLRWDFQNLRPLIPTTQNASFQIILHEIWNSDSTARIFFRHKK